ncbi:hypothetical protein CYMTET_50573 [Cymbomonas tetramitiformis]|uniref:Uncharacterized protein n=1 Tax=Cymbomonas tetramitiformis TaxID=36881 RepID=A0AAE0BMX0_9CHLO|nr:hypothetical protein CYMTET_50573 [Cymbomonas tetramitiformis]
MTAVERTGYMDVHKSNLLKEAFDKETKCRDAFAKKMEQENGFASNFKIEEPKTLTPPPVIPAAPKSMSQQERDAKLGVELSKNLWRRCNPGYSIGSATCQSTAKSDFCYDPEELEPVDKTKNRRRDDFTNYVEASSRHNLMMKAGKGV